MVHFTATSDETHTACAPTHHPPLNAHLALTSSSSKHTTLRHRRQQRQKPAMTTLRAQPPPTLVQLKESARTGRAVKVNAPNGALGAVNPARSACTPGEGKNDVSLGSSGYAPTRRGLADAHIHVFKDGYVPRLNSPVRLFLPLIFLHTPTLFCWMFDRASERIMVSLLTFVDFNQFFRPVLN